MLIILIGRDPQTNQCASSILKPKSRHWRKHRFEYSSKTFKDWIVWDRVGVGIVIAIAIF